MRQIILSGLWVIYAAWTAVKKIGISISGEFEIVHYKEVEEIATESCLSLLFCFLRFPVVVFLLMVFLMVYIVKAITYTPIESTLMRLSEWHPFRTPDAEETHEERLDKETNITDASILMTVLLIAILLSIPLCILVI